jgi:hypothetical protein
MQLLDGACHQIAQFNCDGGGDPHQPSRFQAAAGELGEAQPSELCPGAFKRPIQPQAHLFLVIQAVVVIRFLAWLVAIATMVVLVRTHWTFKTRQVESLQASI